MTAAAPPTPKTDPAIDLPGDIAARIGELNDAWVAKGMPERCRLPTTADGWRALLKMLPNYDPFATAKTGLWFDARRAVQAIGFFHEYLVHIIGEWANTPVWLEPWQQAFIGNLLGWKRADGTRRYRKYLLYVARKNAKTTLIAGLQLEVMVNDGEPGARIDCAAATRDQAKELFSVATEMVARCPELDALLTRYQYSIVGNASMSSFKVLSADANTKHGGNSHSAVIDELHAQPNRDLYDVLETSTASRRQPLVGALTTADYERPSLCNEMHDHARSVCDGRIDDWAFLPAVYEADPADDPADPDAWAKANPNLGVSVKAEYLAQSAEKAANQPAYMNTHLRLHMNIRTQQAEKWIGVADWNACGPPPEKAVALRAREPEPEGGVAVGIDLASSDDFAAMVTVWRETVAGGAGPGGAERFCCRSRFWIPAHTAREREKRGVPISAWARDGWITLTEGTHIDLQTVQAEVLGECRRVGCKSPAFDPWGATQMIQQLGGEGLDPVEYQQSFKNSNDATRKIESLVATRGIAHDGSPVLGWMIGNCMLDRDTMDNVRPAKKKSPEKIDGVIALMMAVGMLIGGAGETKQSVYETRGLLVI